MDNHTEKQGEVLGPPSCFLFVFGAAKWVYGLLLQNGHNYILQIMYKEMGTDEYYGQDITLNVLGLSSTH